MIPVNEPLLRKKELEYVTDCISTGWISSSGSYIKLFEEKWAEYCGKRRYGITVSSGTAALQIAIGCLDLKPGNEVIIPTFTIISCALAVIYNGGKPILVDSDPETWCMDVNQLEAKITSRTRAIMPVHIYGHPVDMDPIRKLADKYNLVIVEDAAEAHCAKYKGQICGSLGDISIFSFYANKIITTGEGGMVITDDFIYAERARQLRNLCFIPERRFLHKKLGHNFRMTNIQAAIGLAQLERIDEIINKKRWIGQQYSSKLRDIPGLQLPVEKTWAENVYWMYGIVLDEKFRINANEFAALLRERRIDSRPFFWGMHEQPIFHEMGLFLGETYPIAERIARQGLYLPSGLTLTQEQINTVCKVVKSLLEKL